MCLQKYIKGKLGEKLNIFYRRLVLKNKVFARTLTAFGFRCRIISVELHVFGIKMLLKKMPFLLLRVQQLAYITYICTTTFIGVCMILEMHTWTCTLIFSLWFFKVLRIFLVLLFWFWLFKNLMLDIWPLI